MIEPQTEDERQALELRKIWAENPDLKGFGDSHFLQLWVAVLHKARSFATQSHETVLGQQVEQLQKEMAQVKDIVKKIRHKIML